MYVLVANYVLIIYMKVNKKGIIFACKYLRQTVAVHSKNGYILDQDQQHIPSVCQLEWYSGYLLVVHLWLVHSNLSFSSFPIPHLPSSVSAGLMPARESCNEAGLELAGTWHRLKR